MQSHGRLIKFACACLTGLAAGRAEATKVHERFSLGGYVSQERFANETGGSDNNDFATVSARSFLRVGDWGAGRWEFIADLRDKHDFFDKFDAERMRLKSRNDFQVRQLSLRKPNLAGRWSPQFGRFALPEAGAVFADGGQLAFRLSRSLTLSGFGGLNPKEEAASYLQFNAKAKVYGVTATLQRLAGGWTKNFYLTHAFVQKEFEGHIDRQFIFHNMHFQWQKESRLLTLVYLDLIPRTYVQTANLIWQQYLGRGWATELQGLAVDAIEYSRRQNILERLPSSPYRQASLQVSHRPDLRGRTFAKVTFGEREVDRRTKTEGSLGWARSGIFSAKWDAHVAGGARKNFASTDQFARTGIGYFSRSWESSIDFDFAIQKYDSGQTLKPLIAEASVSKYVSRKFYWTVSAQRAADEEKTILSFFLKIGIQTSNQELSPIRDGAPPRGSL